MPDKENFDCLPRWGQMHYRCVECGWPEAATPLQPAERTKHFLAHEHERTHTKEITRKQSLQLARAARLKRKLEKKADQQAYA